MFTSPDGYVFVVMHGHPHARWGGRVRQHIAVASAALGKPLPVGAEVHHVNGKRDDNRPCNLVICQDDAYHKLLHVRARVLRAGGDPDQNRICCHCKRVLPLNFFSSSVRIRRRGMCKTCSVMKASAYYYQHKSEKAAYDRRRRGLRRGLTASMYGSEPDSADPGRRWDTPDREDPPQCDRCGATEVSVTVQGRGKFCSRACADLIVPKADPRYDPPARTEVA